MHELTICEALLNRIDQEHATRRFTRVTRVRLEIGRFSCLDPDALRYAFDIMGRGTFLENAVLEIGTPPTRAICPDCGTEDDTDGAILCPACGTGRLKPVGEDNLRLIEMEVI